MRLSLHIVCQYSLSTESEYEQVYKETLQAERGEVGRGVVGQQPLRGKQQQTRAVL